MRLFLSLIILFSVTIAEVEGQSASDGNEETPDPKVAFLKSLAVPGWGHYYTNSKDWRRGQYHLAGELALVLSYVGFAIHSNNIQQNWYSYGKSVSGVAIEGRSRRFQLAVGNFNSLAAYNDYQLRSRNWDQLFEDRPENRWNWESQSERVKYDDLRSRFERIDQQLPALLAMMALNRVISGISAYNRAQKRVEQVTVQSTVYLAPYQFASGLTANIRVRF
jgi:hypothetical protein